LKKYFQIDGDIKDVKFEEDSSQCQKIINNSIKFELPPNMLEVKPLTDMETIVITGKISKFPINVTFLNGAIERHNRSLKKHFSYSLRPT